MNHSFRVVGSCKHQTGSARDVDGEMRATQPAWVSEGLGKCWSNPGEEKDGNFPFHSIFLTLSCHRGNYCNQTKSLNSFQNYFFWSCLLGQVCSVKEPQKKQHFLRQNVVLWFIYSQPGLCYGKESWCVVVILFVPLPCCLPHQPAKGADRVVCPKLSRCIHISHQSGSLASCFCMFSFTDKEMFQFSWLALGKRCCGQKVAIGEMSMLQDKRREMPCM